MRYGVPGEVARWGRLGGLETLRRYGRGWLFFLLGRRSHPRRTWRRRTAEALATEVPRAPCRCAA